MKTMYVMSTNPRNLVSAGIESLLKETNRYDRVNVLTLYEMVAEIQNGIAEEAVCLFMHHTREMSDSIQSIKAIREKNNFLPIIFLAFTDLGVEEVRELYVLGKVGIIQHDIALEELLEYINRLPENDVLLSKHFQDKLLKSVLFPEEKIEIDLSVYSKAEQQIIKAAAEGNNIQQTAAKLNLSPNTVAAYRSRVIKKANTTSISQLLAQINHKNTV